MSHHFLFNSSFHSLFFEIDKIIAQETQETGCPYCGSKLDQAHYPRSVLGIIPGLRDFYQKRLSFCCRACRKRITPASVRFLGRFRYAFVVMILISAMQLGQSWRRLAQLYRRTRAYVSLRTLKRWRAWWKITFQATAFWRQAKGQLVSSASTKTPIVRHLFRQFKGPLPQQCCQLLKWLSPLSQPIFAVRLPVTPFTQSMSLGNQDPFG